jgi:DNA-binding transcriptional MerR regulator
MKNIISPSITNGAEQPVTTAQLARHLQVSTRTLSTYRSKRVIPFWKINARNFRYRLSDVEKALAKCT